MRNLIFAAAGAAALASASTANAAIIVTGSTGVDVPTVMVNNGATQSTVTWGQDLTTSGTFSGSVDLFNSLSGLYSIIVGTSTPGATITGLSIFGIAIPAGGSAPAGSGSFSASGSSSSLSLLVNNLASGNYRVSYTGTAPLNPPGAAVTGNLTFQVVQAVPEPATWAMMMLGFGAIGMTIRRRRRPMLAQIA